MEGLFVCPGFCEDCNAKDCPERDKLDDGLKKEMGNSTLGKFLAREYEKLKRFISPKTVAFLFHNEIKSLMETSKKEGVIVNSRTIEEDLMKIVKEKISALNDYPEGRDQCAKKMFYSVRIISQKIEKYLDGKCNTLFCHDCCIFKICHNEPVNFNDFPSL